MSELSGKMPTKHQELKRCPFCGEAGQLTSGGDCWIAHCSQVAKEFEAEICCHFVPESGYVSTIEEAIAAWNQRPVEEALAKALDFIRTTMICQNYKKHIEVVEAALKLAGVE